MSDREKAMLRGPVKSCLEGFTETIYDEAGRLLTTRHMNPGSSDWRSTRSYDEAGRLTKIMSGKAGEVASETLYAYDEKGRVAEVSVRNVKALVANPTPAPRQNLVRAKNKLTTLLPLQTFQTFRSQRET